MSVIVRKPPEVHVFHAANLFIKAMTFVNEGDGEAQHCHQFDHATLLAHGKFSVTVNGVESIHEAPLPVWIKAGEQHTVIALTPGAVAYCIHALRTPDGEEILDPASIPAGTSALFSAAGLIAPPRGRL